MSDRKIEFEFELNDIVRVRPSRGDKDPGGVGRITAREVKDDNRGRMTLYRVKIPGHTLQEQVAKEKSRRDDQGFWYRSDLIDGPA